MNGLVPDRWGLSCTVQNQARHATPHPQGYGQPPARGGPATWTHQGFHGAAVWFYLSGIPEVYSLKSHRWLLCPTGSSTKYIHLNPLSSIFQFLMDMNCWVYLYLPVIFPAYKFEYMKISSNFTLLFGIFEPFFYWKGNLCVHACVHTQSPRHVWLFVTPWTVACQVPVNGILQARVLELPFPTLIYRYRRVYIYIIHNYTLYYINI